MLFSFGLGVGTKNSLGQWIEVYFSNPSFQVPAQSIKNIAELCKYQGGNTSIEITNPLALEKMGGMWAPFAMSKKPLVAVFLESDSAPVSVPEVYLKLHLLSHRLVKPNSINLTDIFKILPNVAWTSAGPIDLIDLEAHRLNYRLAGQPLEITMVDKFPRMTDYVTPPGVRIADATRVRLGAYLGTGTTVMQEGFINFNAGTEGPNMIEGRVSSCVFVGAGSDLGGGCSTMGVLSGGNSEKISIGKRCLIGANAGVGISLGDDCTVEAGLYITAASKITIVNTEIRQPTTPQVFKGKELSGKSNLLFRRNSLSGRIECLKNKSSINLNPDLHG